jgi:hypothetical protein
MEENKNNINEVKKFTYEQLEQIAHQLTNKVRELQFEVNNIQMSNMFQRLDFLLRIIEIAKMDNKNPITDFNKSFIEDCIREIEDLITIKEKQDIKNTLNEFTAE